MQCLCAIVAPGAQTGPGARCPGSKLDQTWLHSPSHCSGGGADSGERDGTALCVQGKCQRREAVETDIWTGHSE